MNYFFLSLALFFTCYVNAQQYRTHKVQPDESVKSIAAKYHVKAGQIYQLNPDISKGQKLSANLLVIPFGETPDGKSGSKTVQFKEYEVPPKQTLYSLAKENNISIKDLKKFNPYLYKEELGAGDRIRIPIFISKKIINFNESLSSSTFKNLSHIVLPKETKFGISKQYQMSVEELEKKNPGLDTLTLQPGQILKVFNPVSKSQLAKNIEIIEVEPKETFYSLTRRLGISRDSLEKMNPSLRKRGLEAGMKLTIPRQNNLVGINNNLSNQVVELAGKLQNYDRKTVKVLLPFSLNQFKGDTTSKANLKNDRVLQISLDFYSGVMAAFDSVQEIGIPVNAEILDTQNDTDHVQSILKNNDWDDTQVVIGPLLINNLQLVSQYLSNKNIPVVSPLTSQSLEGMSNILQSRPSELTQQKMLFAYIDSLKSDKNLILVSDKSHRDLVKKIEFNFPDIKKVKQAKEEYIQKSDFSSMLAKNKSNWVIFAASDVGLVTNSIAHLNRLSEENDIRVFTTDKNTVFEQEVPSASLEKLKFTYPAMSADKELNKSNAFAQAYEKKHGIFPSHIAIRGFDLTMDIILRLSLKNDLYDSLENKIIVTQYLENRFRYIRQPKGGYTNDAAYLIQYDKDLNLKILN